MKLEEDDFGPDRMIQIETDDEENEAERVCHNHEDDSESDITRPSRDPSFSGMDSDPCGSWPQSYRYMLHFTISQQTSNLWNHVTLFLCFY